MPQREEPFYNAYSYGDKLEPGTEDDPGAPHQL